MTKLSGLWKPIALWATVWAVLLVVLVVGMHLLSVNSTVQGGALGAYCGATLVVIYTIYERSKARAKSTVHERYRR